MKSFSIPELEEKYGIRRRIVSELVKEGFIRPERGQRREYRFSFRDVVMLRMAQDLFAFGISAKKTIRFLQKLRREFPETSLAGLRLTAAGKELVVRHDGRLRNSHGQMVLDFAAEEPTSLSILRAPDRSEGKHSAGDWYRAALLAEESEPVKAVECYRKAIESDRLYADAYINLGCLLLAGEQYLEAFAVLEEGVMQCPKHPLLHFNLAIAYEELKRPHDALACYGAALKLDSRLSDAHFNAARLHESLGHKAQAIRHYNAYRKLEG
jgi:tetratricopeptide (TPR) repeat protein